MFRLETINKKLPRVYSLVKENIYSCITSPVTVSDKKYHHRLPIKDVTSVLEYGLLSRRLKAELVEKRNLTQQEISIYSVAWHVNGVDSISLANIEELEILDDKELNPWDIYHSFFPDIIVSDKVEATKDTTNYTNEYLVKNKIPVELLKSIDIRILKIIDFPTLSKRKKIKLLLEYYEYLRTIAIFLVDNNLSIPLREISEVSTSDEYDKAITLDPHKIMKLPAIK